MGADKTRGNYEELARIASAFAAEESRQSATFNDLRKGAEQLRSGDWIGQGASAFYAEMDSQVLPSLQRLVRAMASASRVTRTLSQTIKQAEEEAARLLNGDGAVGDTSGGGAGSGSGSGSGTGAPGGTPGGASGSTPTGATPAWQQANPLLARDPATLFTDQNMKSLIGKTWQGEGTDALKGAMNTLWDNRNNPNSPAVQQALQQIADARGVPLEKIQADWNKYQQVLAQQTANGTAAEGLNSRNADFMGSRGQLRFGQVVGDAFGVDPVFGALLSPTGGMVGPGNNAFDAGDTAVGYHGAVHDAAGYLYNNHKAGPGYDYLGREGRDTSSPFSGQISGIAYWRGNLPMDWKSEVSQGVMNAFVPVLDTVEVAINPIRNTWNLGSNAVSNIREGDFRGLVSDGWNDGVKLVTGPFTDTYDVVRDGYNSAKAEAGVWAERGKNVLSGAWSLTPWG